MTAINSVIGVVATTLLLGSCVERATQITDAEVIARSIPVAAQFQGMLQTQLRDAMQAGGPIAGVSVCKEAAPAIAASASEASGAEVRRIAALHRNPDAAVPGDMRAAYAALAAAPMVDGEPASRVVRSGVGDAGRIHFLRAIPMQDQPCGACHGTNVAPDVAAHIASLYPADQATGFSTGDMRGALLISWPVSAFAERP